MSNKFTEMLSASNADIKQARAEELAESTILEVDAFITNLKREKNQLKTKLRGLTDLAPDNSYSLRPGTKDFNAAKWMSELHGTKMELELLEVKIKLAEEIHAEWFKAEEAPKTAGTKKK